MEELHISDELRARFQAAMANPKPGYRPVLRVIRPHFKRPPFNRTHRVLRRRHRKKDNNLDHYNVGVRSYVALRWVKEDAHPQPAPDLIVDLVQLNDIPRVVRANTPPQSPEQPPPHELQGDDDEEEEQENVPFMLDKQPFTPRKRNMRPRPPPPDMIDPVKLSSSIIRRNVPSDIFKFRVPPAAPGVYPASAIYGNVDAKRPPLGVLNVQPLVSPQKKQKTGRI